VTRRRRAGAGAEAVDELAHVLRDAVVVEVGDVAVDLGRIDVGHREHLDRLVDGHELAGVLIVDVEETERS